MSTPIKTGAHVFFEEYKTFAVGDMFQINNLYLFRINGQVTEHHAPLRDELHFQIFEVLHEFPGKPHGVVACAGVMDHGYDGKPVREVLPHVKVGPKQG